jgi:hypothetical protein
MQDIRKPYTRSRSNRDLSSRVEQFEEGRYADDYDDAPIHNKPVEIPIKRTRRDLRNMDMYPRRRSTDTEERRYDDEPEEETEDNFHRNPPYRDPRTRYVRRKTSLGTWALIAAVAVIIIGGGLMTYVFDSATVTIVPKYKDVTDFGRPVLFSKNGVATGSVPFIEQTASLTKTKTLTLSETRKVEAKASGKVIIYNNYDSNVQKLIKNTRFESTKGKIYRINQSIEVPGKKGATPGSIEVTLYADSNGADYNSDPTDFTIPGFKGTPRAAGFYARSKGPITGGSSGTMSLASLSDINAAKDELALELDKEVRTELGKIIKDGYIPMYSASEVTYEDNEAAVLQGTASTYQVTATGHLMLADAAQLAQAIAKTVRDYNGEPVRLGYTETLTYTRKDSDHITTGQTFSVLVEGKPRVIWASDIDAIKKMVIGKKRDDFKPLMKTISSIESAEISFSPLWLTHFPSETEKIKVTESLPKR